MGYGPGAMAKKTKADQAAHSVLKVAWEAFDAGDVVQARALAADVLAGTVGPDDEAEAKRLATLLSTPERPVDASVQAVAHEIVVRTKVPGRPYLLAGLAAAVYVLLVALAAVRY